MDVTILLGLFAVAFGIANLARGARLGVIARRLGYRRYMALRSALTAGLFAGFALRGIVQYVVLTAIWLALIVIDVDNYLNGDDDDDGGARRRVRDWVSDRLPVLVPVRSSRV